jgi:hypothetical protein
MNTPFGATLNRHRASLGLPPADDIRDYALSSVRGWRRAATLLLDWLAG